MVDASACVEEIRDTVFKETSLTVSAGIAPNRVRVHIWPMKPLLMIFRC